ncbi:hypothetical protein HEB94_005099 [Actinopolymorpha pittospori]|uniref:Uncharacterized protein n=1 Tax=Actinopolymorpha pittospori TaxID=648752 RepID=A0A927RKH2_9ACTN|nr:hypothetical protein [Actinopolymorpha pittospori]
MNMHVRSRRADHSPSPDSGGQPPIQKRNSWRPSKVTGALHPGKPPSSSVAGNFVELNDHLSRDGCPSNQPIQRDCRVEARTPSRQGRSSLPSGHPRRRRSDRPRRPRPGRLPRTAARSILRKPFRGRARLGQSDTPGTHWQSTSARITFRLLPLIGKFAATFGTSFAPHSLHSLRRSALTHSDRDAGFSRRETGFTPAEERRPETAHRAAFPGRPGLSVDETDPLHPRRRYAP